MNDAPLPEQDRDEELIVEPDDSDGIGMLDDDGARDARDADLALHGAGGDADRAEELAEFERVRDDLDVPADERPV